MGQVVRLPQERFDGAVELRVDRLFEAPVALLKVREVLARHGRKLLGGVGRDFQDVARGVEG